MPTVNRGWIQTYTGRKFSPLHPSTDDIDIADVAHGLAMTCRYGGQSRRFYSVAEHCVLISDVIAHARGLDDVYRRRLALAALLHDSAEAYIGDMVRPLKHQPEMFEFRKCEAAIEQAIWRRFHVDMLAMHATIKVFDNRILLDEIAQLMADPDMYTSTLGDLVPLGVRLHCWDPDVAETMFLDRFDQLTAVR